MYTCIYVRMYVYKMPCVYLRRPVQQIRFTLLQSIRFPDTPPPRLFILYSFSPLNSCSSPSSFPSFHNLFSDLLSTILPGIDKGVVQSHVALGRKRNMVLEKIRSHCVLVRMRWTEVLPQMFPAILLLCKLLQWMYIVIQHFSFLLILFSSVRNDLLSFNLL